MTRHELTTLMQEMSLEEKVNQMMQVAGGFFTGDMVAMGPIREKGIDDGTISAAGSVIGVYGAEKVKKIQQEYIEKHPHKIPLLFMLDVINGFKTIFPIPLAQGAAFEPELSGRCAQAAAKEAAVSGVHVTFAPMGDLVRDARWGRVMESTGEDPYLNSLYVKAMVKGFQGDDLQEKYHIAACVKHFAGYGAPTAGRDYNTVELSRHTLREFYLPAYKAGVDADAAMMMTSFNTIDGIPATGNKWLMRDVLREEMGFDGVVISDWGAVEELICHGYCADRREAAVRSVQAGVDIDMMTGIYSEQLCGLIREGVLSESLIDEAVYRILELKNKLGLFENPYKDADECREGEIILCREHRELARESARKSFVLLKNDNILPLAAGRRTAYVEPYTDNRNIIGAWSFIGDTDCVTTIREAVEERGEDAVFCQGCSVIGADARLEGFAEKTDEAVTPEECRRMMEEAIEQAKQAQMVVLSIGEHRLQSGEATSNANIQIPQIQMELFQKVCEVNDQVVVVLFAGRPLDIREISAKAKAVLLVWMPGTEGARAITDVLYGDYNPTGKLPMSFPYCVGQVPVHYNEYPTGRPYTEGRNQGRFRSRYLDIPNRPLYPFGYGQSYTRFETSPVKLDRNRMCKDETIKASVTIKNVGEMTGTETLQLYIRDLAASVVRPVKELKDFCKVTLKPGEDKEVTFTVIEKQLRFWSENGRWESEPGKFEIYIGADSTTENRAEFSLIKK